MEVQTRCVHLNEAEVVAKVIDGEAILINLVSGIYYSMDGSGASIWSMIEAGAPLDMIVANLASEYDVPVQRVSEDVERLIADLVEQRLVVPADRVAVAVRPERKVPAERREYATPTLNVYTDMGDLLALDPPVPGFEDISWEKPRG